MESHEPGECLLYQLQIKTLNCSSESSAAMMKMHRDRKEFNVFFPSQMGQQGRRASVNKKDNVLVPRSSSPVTVYVELPSIIEQAFSTIAWDDIEDNSSVIRRETDSLGSQGNEFDAGGQDFGDYALDFIAESPGLLESSLSPNELVPFQGCVIPPLTPNRDFSPEDRLVHSPRETGNHTEEDGAPWRSVAESHGRILGHSITVNKQLHQSLHRQQEQIEGLEEKNVHLRQLAGRAKHLASVLEKLLTVGDPSGREAGLSCGDKPSLSPCKRQRLDEGYETESSDSVEDILRDISTRCNAVLHSCSTGTRFQQDSDTIRMYGAFSGFQTSVAKDSSMTSEGAEADDSLSSFKTPIREHCTIKTKALPHGHAFTSRTQQGGYRFRWVPKQS